VNGYLLGREYFALVSSRRMDKAAAIAMRKAQKRLAHNGGRLQRVAGALLAHQHRCHRSQLRINFFEPICD
jgi:hypothetical protein